MNAHFRRLVSTGLFVALLGAMPSCGKAPGKPAAKGLTTQDAEFLSLLDSIHRCLDQRRATAVIAKVMRDGRFVAPLLAVLADPSDRRLAAAIRCVGTAPNCHSPSDEPAALPEDDSDEVLVAPAAAAWTDPENPASTRLEPLLLGHLLHREPACRAAAVTALAARQQLPATAKELLEDRDASVRAAAVAACLKLGSPPWPELAGALLSLAAEQVEQLPLDATAAEQLGREVSSRIDWRDTDALHQQLPLLTRLVLQKEGIDALVASLDRGDERLTTTVLAFLAQRGRPLDDCQPVLHLALDQFQAADLRHLAMSCLESCQSPVVAELQQAMTDLDGSLRIAAARVMIRAGSEAGIDVMCDVVQDGEGRGQRALLLLSQLAGASANTPVEELRSRIAARDLRQVRLP